MRFHIPQQASVVSVQLQIFHFLRVAQVTGIDDPAVFLQIIDDQVFRMLFQKTRHNAAAGKKIPCFQPFLTQAFFHLFQPRPQKMKQGTLIAQIGYNLFRQESGIFLHLRSWKG